VRQLVEDSLVVAGLDVLSDEGAELLELVLALEKERGFLDVGLVVRGVDYAVTHVVVKIGAGPDGDALVVNRLVEALQEGGVGPGLVGGMDGLSESLAEGGHDDRILGRGLSRAPLLELDEHRVLAAQLVMAGEGEV